MFRPSLIILYNIIIIVCIFWVSLFHILVPCSINLAIHLPVMLAVCKYFIANVFRRNIIIIIYNIYKRGMYTFLVVYTYLPIYNIYIYMLVSGGTTARLTTRLYWPSYIKAPRQMAGKNKGLRLGRAETQYRDIPGRVFSDSHI